MQEGLATSILLNTVLGTARVETMEEELLSQVIMNPINSTFLLRELMMVAILNTRIPKPAKT